MKFEIERNIFLKGLNLIQGIIEKKKTLPILSNVLIEAINDKITLTATDLEIGITSEYNSQVINNGKITVSAKKLFEIVKELPNNNIILESKENDWIELKCGNAKFNIVALSSDEYPFINNTTPTNKFKITAKLLKIMIEKTFNSISNDESKYNLNGSYLHKVDINNQKYIRIVSTDGHRLSLFQNEFNFENNQMLNDGVIIPRKGIIELKKITDNYDDDLDIYFIDNSMIVKNPETTLIMRLINGNFPDYNRVIPKNLNNFAKINTDTFLHTLKRISILANEKSRGVNIILNKNKLEITSSNPEFGDATDFIDINYNGPEISVGFNSKYLLDVLNNISTKSIKFYISDNISPCLIMSDESNDYQTVIMPMKL